MAQDLKLGVQMDDWTAEPRSATDLVVSATLAEDLGFDSIWTGESWSSDAFSPLAAVAARDEPCSSCAPGSRR